MPENLSGYMGVDPYERGVNRVPQVLPFSAAPPGPIHPSPPPEPAPAPQSTSKPQPPPQTVWVYVRNASSFSGNHPDYADLKARGVGGILVWVDDPLRDQLAQSAHDAGFLVGVWGDPHGADPHAYADHLAGGAAATGAVTVAVDLEGAGKGFEGSDEWDYSADLAAATRAAMPGMALTVTPPPLTGVPTDYNFGAWLAVGSAVWMQIYGPNNELIATPEQIRAVLLANHVPASLATVILPAGTLAQTIPEAQRLGLTSWGIWTIDDVGVADRGVPFGESSPASSQLSGDEWPYYAPPPEPGADVSLIDGQTESNAALGISTDPDTIPWDTPEGIFPPGVLAELDALEAGDESQLDFYTVELCDPGRIHQTAGLAGYPAIDFFGKPGYRVLAPVDGRIVKMSGHDPALGWVKKAGGPFGWSLYIRADGYGGSAFYITHLGSRSVTLGQHVARGQVIGTVGNMPPEREDHIHVGVHGGTIEVRELCMFSWFIFGAATVPLPAGAGGVMVDGTPSKSALNADWHRLMLALDPKLEANRVNLKRAGRGIMNAVQ